MKKELEERAVQRQTTQIKTAMRDGLRESVVRPAGAQEENDYGILEYVDEESAQPES